MLHDNKQLSFSRIAPPLLLFLLLAPLAAFAQQLVTGRVVAGDTEQPLAGVSIRLSGGDLLEPVIVTTDADGRFVVPALAAGTYHVTATLDGYLEADFDALLRPRQSRALELRLRPGAATTEEVVVQASLVSDATNYSSNVVVDDEMIDELPMPRAEHFSSLVTSIVSSAVAGHDNFLHLRGNELSMNYFVNGVSFLDNTHQNFTTAMTPRSFEAVNVVTGGFSAEYGDRFGGILDMTTKSGFAQRGHGSVAAGGGGLDRGNAFVEYGGSSGSWGYYANGSFLTDGRYLNPPEPTGVNNTAHGGHGFLQLDYNAGGDDTVRVVLSGGGTDFDLPTTTSQRQAGRDAAKETRQQSLIASWNRSMGSSGLLTVAGYQRMVRENVLPTSDPVTTLADGRRETLTFGGKVDLDQGLGRGHVLKAGVDVKSISLDEQLAVDVREEEGEEAGGEVPLAGESSRNPRFFAESSAGNEELEVFAFSADDRGTLLGAYVQDEFQPSSRLTLDLGLRFDRFDLVDTTTEVSPRVNAVYAFTPTVAAHAAYNRFYAPPPIEWMVLASTVVDDALPVKPMVSDHVEAGVRSRLGGLVSASATAYYRRDENPFETAEIFDTGVYVPTNFNAGDTRGLELGLRLDEIVPAGISGFLNYTLSKTLFEGPVAGGPPGEELEPGQRIFPAFDQRHTVASGVSWRESNSGLWAGLGIEYGSGAPVEAEEDGQDGGEAVTTEEGAPGADHGAIIFERLPSHLVFNLSIGIDLFRASERHLTLQFNVENLTDELVPIAKESAVTPIQYAPPRAYGFQARFAF